MNKKNVFFICVEKRISRLFGAGLLILPVLVFPALSVFPDEDAGPGKSFPPQAILLAAYRGDVETVKEILAAGTGTDTRDAIGATALHIAVLQPDTVVVKLLLDYGFDPNAVAVKNGYTPLHSAVAAGNAAAARLLIQRGADKTIRNLDGQTPLEKARKEEKRDLVMLLYR